MELYVYPSEPASEARFEALREQVGATKLCFWRCDDLHRTSRELIELGTSRLPVAYEVQRALGGVAADVIVMHRGKEAGIRAVMRHCRDWPRRPVFAVTTKQSVEMSLAVLFEHLMFDRRREDVMRKRRAKGAE